VGVVPVSSYSNGPGNEQAVDQVSGPQTGKVVRREPKREDAQLRRQDSKRGVWNCYVLAHSCSPPNGSALIGVE